MRKLFAVLAVLWFAGCPALAQQSGTANINAVNSNWPDNTAGQITPALLRSTVISIINSTQTASGCPTQVLGYAADGVTPQCYSAFSGALGSISVKVRSSSASTVTASATTDYFFCLDPTSNTITVNLPASPTTGLTFLVKDCTGQSGTHNITITPASGNIDGSSTFVISSQYQSVALTYTGSQWSTN